MKKNLIQSAIALALFGLATGASAGTTNVDLLSPDANGPIIGADVRTLDLAESGSGIAVGAGPTGDPIDSIADIGRDSDFLYQSFANSLFNQSGGTIRALDPTTDGFEYTVVISMTEKVVGFNEPSPTDPFPSVAFLANGGEGTLSIFYDNSPDSNVLAGTGFTDGLEVARYTVTSLGASNFSATGPDAGFGGTSYNFNISGVLDFVNEDYIDGLLGPAVAAHFTSSQVLPVGTSATSTLFGGSAVPAYATHPVTSDDLLLKVDGSLTFAVPEPNPLALVMLGGALMMVSSYRKRNC